MFDFEVEELDASQTADAFGFCASGKLRVQCQELLLAAHWADLHPGEGLPPAELGADLMVGERAMVFGADGTPAVAEFAPAEIAPRAKVSVGQARSLIADAIDLRDRFPLTWRLVHLGIVSAWAVRFLATACRELSSEQAGIVDRKLAPHLVGIGRRRLENLIKAALLEVDAERMAKLAEQALRSRSVRFGQSTEHGMKSVYARMDAADAIRLEATVELLADILSSSTTPIPGVPDRHAQTRDEWRTVALGVTANPLLAAQILIQHQQPELFDVLAELQQPPLEFDPDRDTVPPEPDPEWDVRPPDDADQLTGTCPVDQDHPVQEPDQDAPEPDQVVPEPDQIVPEQDQFGSDSDRLTPFLRQEYRRLALRQLLRHLDLSRLLPAASLNVHYYPGDDESPVARVEELGPASLEQVRQWLGTGCQVTVQPVIDLNAVPAVDAYEVPDRLRTAILCRNPASVFPFSSTIGRSVDLDHTRPYRRRSDGSPAEPGQTGMHNLAPLSRAEHRFVTHGRISVRQPEPGVLVWRTRYGQVLLTSAAGTFDLGSTAFGTSVWHAARDSGTVKVV